MLAVAIAALYDRVLGCDFVKYDDHELLVDHYGDLVRARNLAGASARPGRGEPGIAPARAGLRGAPDTES